MPTRQEQKQATRQALKDAARRSLGERPFQSTPVGAIAQAAGVATGTFYVHFPSKEALLDELLDEFNQDLTGRLEAAWSDTGLGDPQALVRRLAETCLDAWAAERALLEAYVRRAASAEGAAALGAGINPPVVALLTRVLETAGAALGSPLPNPALVAHGLLGLWTRIGLQYLFAPDVSRAEAVETLTLLSLGAVRAVFPGLDR